MPKIENQKIIREEQCCEIIRKKLRLNSTDDFSLVKYEIMPLNGMNGFMGQYFTLKIVVACPKSSLETKSIKFFIKTLPPISSPQYGLVQEVDLLNKEAALYTKVFSEMLDDSDKRCIPECFLEIDNYMIILEDMVSNGYIVADKFTPFDFQHCEIIVRALAKFHARSFIFEQQYKKTLYDEFSYCMQETLWPRTGIKSKAMFDSAVKSIVPIIDLLPGLNDDQRSDFKEKFVRLCADHTDKLSPSIKHKNVLCHGDLWTNNILFKYNAEKRPVECCFVDFQNVRYNPPAHDILCFLQFTTTRKLQEQHSETLFKIYHDSIATVIKENGLDISEILPWSKFIESIQDLRTTCIIHGVLNISTMLLNPNVADKYLREPRILESLMFVDRSPMICEHFEKIPEYRARLTDSLLELYDHVAV